MLAHIEAIARCSKPAFGKSVVRALNAQQRYKGTLQKPVKSQADMVKELAKYIGGREQDKEGFFVRKPSYTEKDFENSSFVKYMKQVDREGLQLVQEKLQLLAKTSGIPVDQLQRKLMSTFYFSRVKNKTELLLRKYCIRTPAQPFLLPLLYYCGLGRSCKHNPKSADFRYGIFGTIFGAIFRAIF